ncbi:MAG: hypothetical protein ACK4HV_01620 [Parachlamydiaceae bacterium]
MINSDSYGIKDQNHYDYLKARNEKCAELFFKSKLITPIFSMPNPREAPFEESIKMEIRNNYPKLTYKKGEKPNFLGEKDFFGIAIDFLYESYNSSLDELCELFTEANQRALITQTIYLTFKTECLLKKGHLQYITFFSSRYRLQLERMLFLSFENEEAMPILFGQKIDGLKQGKYLIRLSDEISLALIKLTGTRTFIFDPAIAFIKTLDPAKDLWKIASKYGFSHNRFEVFAISKLLK